LQQIAEDRNESGNTVIIGLHKTFAVQGAQLESGWVQNAISFHNIVVLRGLLLWQVIKQAQALRL